MNARLALSLVPPLALSFALIAASPGFAEEGYGAWRYSRTVRVNAAGLGLSAPVTHFPVLIRLHAGVFDFSAARPGGEDIRFSREDGATPLPHEIERWDAANRVAEIWVLADTVRNEGLTAFRMYFGNDTAVDGSGGGAVFTASNGFKAVWHMGNPSGNRTNSVSGGNAAVPNNYSGQFWPGVIAGADSLRGGNGPSTPGDSTGRDYLDIGDGYADFTGGFTYSAWVYPTAVRGFSRFIDLNNGGTGAGTTDVTVFRRGTTDSIQFRCECPGTAGPTAAPITLNQWQHFTVVRQPGATGAVSLYKNGTAMTASPGTGSLTAAIANVNRIRNFIGRSNNYGNSDNAYYQGKIDEPRLSGVARSADWIKLSYETQKPEASLVTLGEPERQWFRLVGPPFDSGPQAGHPEFRAHYADGIRHEGVWTPYEINRLEASADEGLLSTMRGTGTGETILSTRVTPWGLEAEGIGFEEGAGITHVTPFGVETSGIVEAAGVYAPLASLDTVRAGALKMAGAPSFETNWMDVAPGEGLVATLRNGSAEDGEIMLSTRVSPFGLETDGGVYAADVAASHVEASTLFSEFVGTDSLYAAAVVTTPKWRVPDYVFDPSYERKSLPDLEAFVRSNRHLPGVPSARDIQARGMDLAEMNLRLLKTVEELTLHVIDLDKELKARKVRKAQKVRKARNGRTENEMKTLQTRNRGR